MADIAEKQGTEPEAGNKPAHSAAAAFKDAGVAFVLALVLLGCLAGMRMDSGASGLEITYHWPLAFGMAGAIGAFYFVADIVVWRPLDGGRTLDALIRAGRKLRLPAIAAIIGLGLFFFAQSDLRAGMTDWAAQAHWSLGKAIDLAAATRKPPNCRSK